MTDIIHIGIDPDLRKSGIAIIEKGLYTKIFCMTAPELFAFIAEVKDREDVLFTLEDVNHTKPTFKRKDVKSQAVQNNVSQKVGMVKGVATVIQTVLDFHECQYELVKPLKGELKRAKDNVKHFARLTGWVARTNADSRDAAMLIYKYMNRCAKYS